jgi:hypothetical protein
MLRKILLRLYARDIFRDHLQDIEKHASYLEQLQYILDSEEVFAIQRRATLIRLGDIWLRDPAKNLFTKEARIGILLRKKNYRYCHHITFETGVWVFTVYPDGSVRRRFLESIYPIKNS